MIKVRTVSTTSIDDCKMLQALLNDGYTIIRADHGNGTKTYACNIIYILEKK